MKGAGKKAAASVLDLQRRALEVLAGIPTVVYGYFALTFVTPALRSIVLALASTALAVALALPIAILIARGRGWAEALVPAADRPHAAQAFAAVQLA